MSSPEALIDADFQQWRLRYRRLVWIRGACWVAAAIVTTLWLTGWLDFLWRPRDWRIRWGLTTIVIGVALVTVWRVLIRPLRLQIDSSRLARILECLMPHSGGEHSLATRHDDASRNGSMQTAVTRAAAEMLRRYPSHRFLRPEASRRPAAWLIVAVAAVMVTASLAAQETWTALRRVAMPWASFAFPQYDWLVLVDSKFIPVAEANVIDVHETVRWYVIDERGSPPEELWLQLRRDNSIESRPLEMEMSTAPDGRPTLAGLIELSFDEPFELRVVGGDDRHMPWVHVNVYHPPRVSRFAIATTPPEYAGRERSQTESLSGRIECLVGSHVDVTATFDQPLSQAWLIREGSAPHELQLRDDGRRAVASWTVSAEGTSKYQFEVVGEEYERRSLTRSCEVQGVRDELPTIEVEIPPASMLVTESASVPIEFTARDDLGVDEVAAAYSLSMSADAESYRLPTSVERLSDGVLTAAAVVEPQMLGATIGDRISVWAEATDRFNLGAPHLSRSPVRTLSVVTEDDKLQEIDARLDALIEQLRHLERMASQSVDVLAELRIQVETARALSAGDIEIVRKVLFETQSSIRDLFEVDSSILSQVEVMRRELDWNGLQSAEITTQLDTVLIRLAYLQEHRYPEVLQELSLLLEEPGVVGQSEFMRERETSVVRAWQSQQEIARTLAEILETLGEFRRFGSLMQAVGQLRQSQESLNQDTLRVAESTVGRDWRELSPQQHADLGRLAERQSQSATVLSSLVEELEQDSVETRLPAATAEVRERIADPQLVLTMRQSASLLGRNDLGQAMPAQQTVLTELAAIEELLAGPRVRTQAVGQDLQVTLSTFSGTLTSQRELLELISQFDGQVSQRDHTQWARMQFDLLTEAEQALIVQRATSREPWVQAARRAVSRMRQAHLAITQYDWDRTRVEQQEAVDDLVQSVEQLQSLIAERRRDEVADEMERLPERLQYLIDHQTGLLTNVSNVDRAFSLAGQWNRDLLKSVREAAQSQQTLAEETSMLLTSLTPWPAFHFAVDDAMLMMHEVATRLDDRETNDATQRRQQQIIDRLEQVSDSLSRGGQSDDPQSPEQTNAENTSRTPDTAAWLSQIRLLKELQSGVRDQTVEVVQSGDVRPSVRGAIADRQRGLADLAEPLFEDWLTDNAAERGPAAERIHQAVAEVVQKLPASADALEQMQFSPATVAMQDGVIAALDLILKEAQSSSTLLAGQDQGATDVTQSTSPEEGQPSESTGTSDGGSTTAANGGETATSEEIEVQRARDRDLVIDVWGHLPPREQQQLEADFSAEFLPEYDDWIRRYYEALAEER